MLPDGKLESLMGSKLEFFGACPNVGDIIISEDATGEVFYSVQRRYFTFTWDSEQGWAIIVRPVEVSQQMTDVRAAWLEDTRFWREADEKERKKKADATSEAALKFLSRKKRSSENES